MKEDIQSVTRTGITVIVIAATIYSALHLFVAYFCPHTVYSTPNLSFMPKGKVLTKQQTIKIRNNSAVSASASLQSEIQSFIFSMHPKSELVQMIIDLNDTVDELQSISTSKKVAKLKIPKKALSWNYSILQNHFAVYTWIEQEYIRKHKCSAPMLTILLIYNKDLIRIETNLSFLNFGINLSTATITK